MSKNPPQLPPNPFSHPDTLGAPPRSAYGGFSDGTKVSTPSTKLTPQDMVEPPKVNDPNAKAAAEKAKNVDPKPRSAVAGFDQGNRAGARALESGDFPAAKKNPFERKPKPETKSLRPEATQVNQIKPAGLGCEAGVTKKPEGPEVITTSKGLEVTQVKAQNPDEFAQRLKEVQKPASAAEIKEVTADNYTKVYTLQEKERLETQQAQARQQQIETQKAQETSKLSNDDQVRAALDAQAQLAKNAALAQQARDLQAKMAQLRSQLGPGDNNGVNAAIEECRIQLAQIPTGLQG